MSGGTYVLGLATLVAIVAPVCVAARALRIRFLPDASGPLAFLAGAVIAIALLEAAAQLVGTFGLLERIPLVVVAAGSCIAIVAVLARRRGAVTEADSPSRSPGGSRQRVKKLLTERPSTLVVVALVVALLLPWLARTIGSLRTGILGYDSLNYHLPFAGRFFQTGRETSLYFTFPAVDTAFHPANDEVVHAVGMLATQRDIVSPLVNLGWLGLALLAAWCAHRQRAVKAMTLAGVGALLCAPLFVAFSGGRATNDIAGIALFLASVALVLNCKGQTAPIGLAAIASGMAVATKLTMAIPVLALTIGVIVIAVGGSRRKTALVWLPWLLVTGSYWYIRNLVAVGNPVPALEVGLGPVSLPSPTETGPYRSFSVAHYLTDVEIWREWFLPGLRDAFGVAWPVILVLAAVGWIVALVRGDRVLRMLAVVGIVSFVGYLFTPAGAGGVSGRPVLFASDTRFAFPALALGLLLLPRVVPRTSTIGRWGLPALLGITVVNGVAYSFREELSYSLLAGVIEVVLLATAVGVLVVWLTRSVRLVAAIGAVLLVLVSVAGWRVERSYLARRYARPARDVPYGSAPRAELAALYRWVRRVSDDRIALVGLGISYPFFGRDLSNTVDYIGHRGPSGDFDEVTNCREWRELLNDGHYDYVVISPDTGDDPEPLAAEWTRSDPAAQPVVDAGKASVFRVNGTFQPDACDPD